MEDLNYTDAISIRCSKKLKRELRKKAIQDGVKFTNFVRDALIKALAD